jgi:O-antigen/teichoic acid export membrane protein
LLAESLISNWINPEYGKEAAYLTQILVSAWFFQAWGMTTIEIYRGQGDICKMSILVLFGALCQVTLAIILLQIISVIGAAISTIVYYLIMTPLQIMIVSRKIGFDVTRFVTQSVLPIYGVTAIFVLLLYVGINYIGEPANTTQIIISFITLFVFMTVILFATVAREEGHMILGKLLLAYRSKTNREFISR